MLNSSTCPHDAHELLGVCLSESIWVVLAVTATGNVQRLVFPYYTQPTSPAEYQWDANLLSPVEALRHCED